MTRDEWCTKFVNYLVVRTDREVSEKFAGRGHRLAHAVGG
jgi:hypothetical protein